MNLHSLSIKQKVVIGITFAVLASTILLGIMAQKQSRDVISHRLVDIELPLILNQINLQVDKDVSQLLSAAEQLAKNEFVRESVRDTADPQGQTKLIKQLNNVKEQYQLNDASVANRQTAYYWNQNGFLRQLNQSQDGWFFGFTNSGKQTMVSIFTEANGEVKMFANYQHLSGFTMSGVSKSMDDMVDKLNGFQIEDSGYVFLVDSAGKIQIHRDKQAVGKPLSSYIDSNSAALLT